MIYEMLMSTWLRETALFIFKFIKNMCLVLIFTLVSMSALAESGQTRFKYEYTQFIIHFTPEGQIYNGRPNDIYNPKQHFNHFYDLLIRHVYLMEPFNSAFSISDIGVWHEMHMVSQFGSQVLYVGDHILSDGQSWVIISEQDYMNLQEHIKTTKRRDKQPLSRNKKALISRWVDQAKLSSNGDAYAEHFQKYAPYHTVKQDDKRTLDVTNRDSSIERPGTSSSISYFPVDSKSSRSSSTFNHHVGNNKNSNETISEHHFSSSERSESGGEGAQANFEERADPENKKPFTAVLILIIVVVIFTYLKRFI
jgi:hypothetical protein